MDDDDNRERERDRAHSRGRSGTDGRYSTMHPSSEGRGGGSAINLQQQLREIQKIVRAQLQTEDITPPNRSGDGVSEDYSDDNPYRCDKIGICFLSPTNKKIDRFLVFFFFF
jgi:hypothetical protein